MLLVGGKKLGKREIRILVLCTLIPFVERSDNCLKNLTVKGLCGRYLSVEAPSPPRFLFWGGVAIL
jgi:hypothetical protein